MAGCRSCEFERTNLCALSFGGVCTDIEIGWVKATLHDNGQAEVGAVRFEPDGSDEIKFLYGFIPCQIIRRTGDFAVIAIQGLSNFVQVHRNSII
jgi:hypothetical protein